MDVKVLTFSEFRPEDEAELAKVQSRFACQIPELPDQIDMNSYM